MQDRHEKERTLNHRLRQQRELRGWSHREVALKLQDLFPEVAVTANDVRRWESGERKPGPYYRPKLCVLFGATEEQLGLIPQNISCDQNVEEGETAQERGHIDVKTYETVDCRRISTHAHLKTDEAIEFLDSELPLVDILHARRQWIQTTLSQACTILTLSPNIIIHSEGSEQLMRPIIQPSCISRDILDHLFDITRKYWEIIDNAPFDFLGDILYHFQSIMRRMNQVYNIPGYQRLCSLAGQHALVIGRTLYDMREYNLALSYCTFSVRIAQEVGNEDLRATSLGRIALVLLYAGQPERANLYLREAQRVQLQRPWIGAWLSAIEAELHAHAGNLDAFTTAMETSKNILARYPVGDDAYASITRFNTSMQLGFEAAGFLRLKKSGAAVPILQRSLSSLQPSSLRRRSTLLTDMGKAHALQGDVKAACTHFHQALDIIAQTKVLLAFQRMYSAQRELNQWKYDPQVEALAEHITNTLAILRRTNNG